MIGNADSSYSPNGSTSTGQCSTLDLLTCLDPASSILFDGDIPSLSGVTSGSQSWASRLLAIPVPVGNDFGTLVFDFANVPGFFRIDRIEVTLFNCPRMGLGVQSIEVSQSSSTYSSLGTGFTTFAAPLASSASSCTSLVRVCIPVGILQRVVTLNFRAPSTTPLGRQQSIYIAEIEFFSFDSSCTQRDGFVTRSSFSLNRAKLSSSEVSATNTQCSSCSTSSYVLTAFLTAVITAIVTTVLFTLVMCGICKYFPKLVQPGGGEALSTLREQPASTYKKFDEERDENLVTNEPSNNNDQ